MEGWISLYRQIQISWLWEEKPFTRGQAWIDMLLSANHKDNKLPFDGKLYEVKRGSFITSIRKLCDRWGWSNTKVVSFLDLCVSEEMILYKSDTKKTVVTIVNYDFYQVSNDTETSQKRQQNDAETTQKHTNNNDNNTSVVVEGEETAAVSLEPVDNVDNSIKQITKAYSENIGQLTPAILFKIEDYLKDMDAGAVVFAIEQAAAQGNKKYSYIEGILKSYKSNNIKTMADAEEAKRKFDEVKNKKKDQKQNAPSNKPGKPTFNNFRNRTYDTKKLEEAMIARGRAELDLHPEFHQREDESIEEWQKRILALRKVD